MSPNTTAVAVTISISIESPCLLENKSSLSKYTFYFMCIHVICFSFLEFMKQVLRIDISFLITGLALMLYQ